MVQIVGDKLRVFVVDLVTRPQDECFSLTSRLLKTLERVEDEKLT